MSQFLFEGNRQHFMSEHLVHKQVLFQIFLALSLFFFHFPFFAEPKWVNKINGKVEWAKDSSFQVIDTTLWASILCTNKCFFRYFSALSILFFLFSLFCWAKMSEQNKRQSRRSQRFLFKGNRQHFMSEHLMHKHLLFNIFFRSFNFFFFLTFSFLLNQNEWTIWKAKWNNCQRPLSKG